ncbi:MAG TPA: hypothetical protein VIY47_08445, partial [Ignavibacteriaceae bacterium]
MISKYYLLKLFTIALLISIALTFTAFGCMNIHSDDDLQLIQEKTFSISPGKKLLVDLSSGDVKVTYWDKSEVHIKIFGNEKAFDKMNFTLNGD